MISSASPTLQNFVTDTWVKASWEEFDDGAITRWLLQTFSQR